MKLLLQGGACTAKLAVLDTLTHLRVEQLHRDDRRVALGQGPGLVEQHRADLGGALHRVRALYQDAVLGRDARPHLPPDNNNRLAVLCAACDGPQ